MKENCASSWLFTKIISVVLVTKRADGRTRPLCVRLLHWLTCNDASDCYSLFTSSRTNVSTITNVSPQRHGP